MSDVHHHDRLCLLAELMQMSPDKPVRKLQREALKAYPLTGTEAVRSWMSMRTAFAAADISNSEIIARYERECQ